MSWAANFWQAGCFLIMVCDEQGRKFLPGRVLSHHAFDEQGRRFLAGRGAFSSWYVMSRAANFWQAGCFLIMACDEQGRKFLAGRVLSHHGM